MEVLRSGAYSAVRSEEKDNDSELDEPNSHVQSLRRLRLLLRLSTTLLCVSITAIGFLLFARPNEQTTTLTDSASTLIRTPVPPSKSNPLCIRVIC